MSYFKRIQKEINSEIIFISDQKKIFPNYFKENDLVILIDEKGKHYDSISFSKKFKMLIQNSKKKSFLLLEMLMAFLLKSKINQMRLFLFQNLRLLMKWLD